MRRDSARRSAARIIIFDGMHPQYGHSPPTSPVSMPMTDRPADARLPATSSPPGPIPSTTTSAMFVITAAALMPLAVPW